MKCALHLTDASTPVRSRWSVSWPPLEKFVSLPRTASWSVNNTLRQRHLGAPHRVRAIVCGIKSKFLDPALEDSSVLPRSQMWRFVNRGDLGFRASCHGSAGQMAPSPAGRDARGQAPQCTKTEITPNSTQNFRRRPDGNPVDNHETTLQRGKVQGTGGATPQMST